MIQIPENWFGTTQGLWRLFEANAMYRESPVSFPPKLMDDDDDDEEPSSSPLIQVQDGVALLSISGPRSRGSTNGSASPATRRFTGRSASWSNATRRATSILSSRSTRRREGTPMASTD